MQNLEISANSGPGVEAEKLAYTFDLVVPMTSRRNKMIITRNFAKALQALAGAGLTVFLAAGCKPAAAPAAARPPLPLVKTNLMAVAVAGIENTHESVFEDLMPPRVRPVFSRLPSARPRASTCDNDSAQSPRGKRLAA